MKGFISISLLCGALAAAQAQDFSYQMRYGTRTETINVSVKKTDDGYTITNQQERELRTIDTDVTFTASSFRFKDSDAGTDYTAQRAGNKILVTGILKRQAVVREFSINDNPWFQSIEQALEYFTALRITKVIFWFMNADDCEIMEMEATKEKAEIITVMETSVFAQGIKVNLTGLASLFWRADYWFRCSDGRFVRYETTEGPGGPRIIIESTGEPVNR